MSDIVWQPVTVPLSALVPWDRNPKTISKAHARRMLDLWQRLGQFQTIAIGPAGEVYDGHQRLSVLKAAHGPRFEVTALQSDRALTEKEREELTVAAHVGTTGQFNWDELSGWDTTDLQTWGFDDELVKGWREGLAAMIEMQGIEVIGAEIIDDATRNTNNMSLIGKGENVGFQFGDIMVVINRGLYDRVWAVVDSPDLPDRRAGVMQILEAGLADYRPD